ncbi:MAG: acetyltransferase [Subtercola sp.]|jgi:predicted GNAT family acetyltransferase|nr:acetyltransferase [Subtercola sp.]
MSTEIANQPEKNRYVLLENGEEAGFVDYHLHGDEIVFTHTEVDPLRRRNGIASALITGALDDVRTGTGLKVVPECPFVVRFIDTHPEYHELVERG